MQKAPTENKSPASTRFALGRSYRIVFLFLSIMGELVWYSVTLRNEPPDVADPEFNSLYRRQAIRFRQLAEEMGGILIKVGQFLSSRVDLLPKPYLDELAKLQDHVQAAPWSKIQVVLDEELGPLSTHFLWFSDTPVAAASLGQVYEARLVSGEHVAVKVQRPHIETLVDADLKALNWVVNAVTRLTEFGRTFDLKTVLKEFRRFVFEELDYYRELQNTELIRQDLKSFPHVIVPKTYPEHSTGRILVMDFYEGIKIDDVEELLNHDIDPAQVAERIIRLYLHMVLETGVYHADPHAGNILVNAEGDLILLDYGMVGSLDIATKRNIRHLFVAVSGRDPSALLNAMSSLGMVRADADLTQLRRRISYLLDRYYAETLDQLGQLDIPQMIRDFEAVLRDRAIQVPGYFAFLGRAIAILVGLATAIYPDINLIELFAPYAQRFVTEEAGGTAAYATREIRRYGQTLLELPRLSQKVLRSLDQGELSTQIQWPRGSQELQNLNRGARSIMHSIYVVGFVIAGVLTLKENPWLGRSFLILAAITFIGTWVARHRS